MAGHVASAADERCAGCVYDAGQVAEEVEVSCEEKSGAPRIQRSSRKIKKKCAARVAAHEQRAGGPGSLRRQPERVHAYYS